MGQIREITINRFDGGISTDEREPAMNKCNLVTHFDIFTSPHKLIPYRDTTADEHDGIGATGMKARDARHFQLGLDGKLYALTKVVATGVAEVCSKADPTSGNWAVEATSQSTGARVLGAFIEWKSNFYMFTGTTSLSRWNIGGTFTDAVSSLTLSTITSVAQGVIGSDDNLYMFYNNKVIRVSAAGVAVDDVLAGLPSNMRITSACRYGSYIAIGMAYGTSATSSSAGESKVFLWDMVDTTYVADVIDWGEGTLRILDNVEGSLVGVSSRYLEKSIGGDDLGIGKGAMVIKRWTGGIVRVVKELVATQSVPADTSTITRFPRDKVVKDNKLYWVASIPFGTSTSTESTYNLGTYSFGRKDANSDFALALEYIEDSVNTSNFYINSFGAAGNYWFFNHSADFSIDRTSSSELYTTTSVYETQKFGRGGQTKKLFNTTVEYEPLARTATMTIASPAVVTLTAHGLSAGDKFFFTTTGALPTGVSASTVYYVIATGLTADAFQFSATSGGSAINSSGSQSGVHTAHIGQVVLKYKKDRELSWTTIFTETSDIKLRHTAINIESSGATLPLYREIEFRLESTKGMSITGFKFKYEEIEDDIT